MTGPALLRQKVEAGEPLTSTELGALERAAARDQGMRVYLAHGLLDAGQAYAAESLFAALVSAAPQDPQPRLGRGRALAALERWAEAERELREALRLQPEDPEVLKSLAALALRKGERARASQWTDEVLRLDPFDTEGQLLRAELDATGGGPFDSGLRPTLNADQIRPPAVHPERSRRRSRGTLDSGAEAPTLGLNGGGSEADFVAALLTWLKARGAPHLLEGEAVVVKVPGGPTLRLDLGSLYRGFRAEGLTLAAAIEALGARIVSEPLPLTAQALLAKVLPVLRPPGFERRASGSAWVPGPAGLGWFFVLEDPELVRYLPKARVKTAKVSLEEVAAAAAANLDARPAELRRLESGLWTLASGDGHDPARLFSPSAQPALNHALEQGEARVFLGRREQVVLCRSTDARAVEALEALFLAEDGIEGRFRRLPGGTLERLGPERD